jgi:GTP-binding protein LepA
LVRVRHGVLKKGMKIRMMATGATHVIERVGVFAPKPVALDALGPGEIGFINAGVKRVPMPRLAIPSPKTPPV